MYPLRYICTYLLLPFSQELYSLLYFAIGNTTCYIAYSSTTTITKLVFVNSLIFLHKIFTLHILIQDLIPPINSYSNKQYLSAAVFSKSRLIKLRQLHAPYFILVVYF